VGGGWGVSLWRRISTACWITRVLLGGYGQACAPCVKCLALRHCLIESRTVSHS
jgi:hypothetical protein